MELNRADVFRSETFTKLRNKRDCYLQSTVSGFQEIRSAPRQWTGKKAPSPCLRSPRHFSSDGILGSFCHANSSGLSYRKIRQALAKRYDEIEIVNLPRTGICSKGES